MTTTTAATPEAVAIAMEDALDWAVRDSLTTYVTKIARGGYTVDGGAVEREGGVFSFPLRRAVREGADWRFSFVGSVRFVAHGGLMDILIKDPEIVVGPDRGVLATHVADDPDELLAVVALAAALPEADEAGLTWSGVPTQLAPAAVDLFGTVYPAGTEMAPISIRIALDS
ncbi:HtaA domain-containing protein [Agromyces allii]|uniref:Htaa domain-containing protein n=1 Tax=Agromyces allii TaxID=393607 RepID=A0ABP5CSV2_9MICO|nr:HtaA domain-containing protein [Agromyces allii]